MLVNRNTPGTKASLDTEKKEKEREKEIIDPVDL